MRRATTIALVAAMIAAAACGHEGGGADAAAIDAGGDAVVTDASPADASGDAAFACGGMICAPDQFCYQTQGGAVTAAPMPDASPQGPICDPIPTACEPSPTCACVTLHTATPCPSAPQCSQDADGHMYVTCSLP